MRTVYHNSTNYESIQIHSYVGKIIILPDRF